MSAVDYRRALHRIPELDCHLPETAAYVRGVLSGLHCRVFSPWKSAVCAYFDYGQPETVAFRSDMDALPICETTGLPFASQHPGKMHACGHDVHAAVLFGVLQRLAADPDFGSDFLGGQNHIALFAEAAAKIDMSNAGPYDQGLNESLQNAFKDYFTGNVDEDTAKANFETAIKEKYPELTEVVWPA